MQIISPNGEKIFNLTAGKTMPEWLEEAKKRSLRKNQEYRSRITLIQDLYFGTSCQKLQYSRDGKYLAATGVYPPSVNVYELAELTVKFNRHLDAPIVDFQILSDDYSKIVFLRNDRTLEFHSKPGVYYKTRVPKMGRAVAYDYSSCDLLTVGEGNEVFRLNLERGMFQEPLVSTCERGINACQINPLHGLYAFAGEDGIVEFWDPRETKRPIGFIDAGAHARQLSRGFVTTQPEASAIKFNTDGLTFGVGTSSGQALIYDLRTTEALKMKDHQYGAPIVDIHFRKETGHIISACKKIVKIWGIESNELFCSLEPEADINSLALEEGSGILLMACEQPKIHTYYIPGLGPAPKWCSFLDNVTSELEEAQESVIYHDYRFLTQQELHELGIEKMIGTPYLRAYMHGFFVDARLYDKVRALARPNEFEEYRKQRIQENIAKRRESRITMAKGQPTVNQEFAKRLGETEKGQAALLDGRFGAMFQNPAFERDPDVEANIFVKKKKEDEREEKEQKDEEQEDDRFSEVSDMSEDEVEESSISEDDGSQSSSDGGGEGDSQDETIKFIANGMAASYTLLVSSVPFLKPG